MNSSNTGGELVTVGSNTQIDFHQLQDIYNSLTGKTESISQLLEKPYRMKFEDIEQLHQRITQCCSSYGARVKNEAISIFHINGRRETFSSFDRFRLYNKSNVSPVENVHIDYNILIVPSGSVAVKQYKISFDFPSRVGVWEKQPDLAGGPIDLMRLLGSPSGRVKIEYVDYAAARHFLAQIEEWYAALDCSAERQWLRKIQNQSHLFRLIFPFISVSFLFYTMAQTLRLGAAQKELSGEHFGQLYLVISVALLAWLVFLIIARIIEMSVDRIQPISYVSINRGDEKCVQKWQKSNLRSAVFSLFGVAVAFGVNILSSFIFERYF